MKIRNAWRCRSRCVAALGCGEGPRGPTTAEFNQAREALKNRIARKSRASAQRRPAPAGRGPATPSAPVGDLGGVGQAATVYDETGKRDPFRSFLLDRAERLARARGARAARAVRPRRSSRSRAVVWQTGNARALIADPVGRDLHRRRGRAHREERRSRDRDRRQPGQGQGDVHRLPRSGDDQGHRVADASERGGMSSMAANAVDSTSRAALVAAAIAWGILRVRRVRDAGGVVCGPRPSRCRTSSSSPRPGSRASRWSGSRSRSSPRSSRPIPIA